MAEPLRVLVVEDNERDAALLLRELKRGGYNVVYTRVDTPEAMRLELQQKSWDLVVSDYSMPRFSAQEALDSVKEAQVDLPFIIVSGTVDETTAVKAMRAGAHDFMPKGQFTRLLPAIARELREAAGRARHRTTEQQLRHAQKMEALGKLTGGIAHDFNNLLGVIVGNLDLLGELASANPAQTELIDAALSGALRGAELTKRLLAFARQQPLAARSINLNDLLSSTVVMLQRTLGERITVETELACNLWPVRIDRSQVEDGLLNLAINARDAMPGGGTITVATANTHVNEPHTTYFAQIAPGDYVALSVTDTGSDIPAEIIERVIEPFFTTKPHGRGTGLGLSMIYGLVRQCGGYLDIASKVGAGTTVTLYFPRSREGVESVEADPAIIPTGTEHVLVVEDNINVAKVAVGMLSSLGYAAEARNSPLAALACFRERRFDVLFSDMVMPEMNGLALANAARDLCPDIAVLLTSGYPDGHADLPQLEALGAEFMAKPYRKADLAVAVRAALANASNRVRRAS
jgi:signal transduction histidine kinase